MQQTKGGIQFFLVQKRQWLVLAVVNLEKRFWIIDAACINKRNNAKLRKERLEEILRGFKQ